MSEEKEKQDISALPESMNTGKIEKKSNRKIALGTILGYVSLALSIISGLVFTPWIIRTIGSSGHGVYTLSISLVNMFLIDFGLGATANTFLARYRANKDVEGERNFLGVIYKIYLLIDAAILVVLTIVYFLIPYIYQGLTSSEIGDLQTVYLITAMYSLIAFPTAVFNGVISAYEEFIWAKVLDILQRVLYIALTILAITLGWGLYGLVAGNCLSAIIVIIAKYILMKSKLKVRSNFRWKAPPGFFRQIFAFAGWAMASSIAARLMWNFGSSVLGVVSDSGNISAFGVVSSLEGYFYSFGSVMSGLLLPKVARMLQEKSSSQEEIDLLAIKIAKIQNTILLLALAGFIAVGKDFVDWWLSSTEKTGEEYLYVHLSTCLVIAPAIVNTSELIYLNQMYVQNKIKYLAIADIVKATINIGLMFLFGYFWGALGACISISIATVIEVIMKTSFMKKKLGAKMGRFFLKSYLPLLVPTAVSLTVGFLIHFLVPLDISWRFLIGAIAMVLVYLPLVFLLSYCKEERKGLFGMFKRSGN